MATSFRHVVRGVHGRVPANFNMPDLIRSRQAVVQLTAGEITFNTGPSQVGGVQQDFIYVRGDADIRVSNACPHFNDHFEGNKAVSSTSFT